MKTKRTLIVVILIDLLAFIAAVYCFWLMTVPLSYDLVYVVLGGFIVSVGVFLVALISSIIIAARLRRSRRARPDSEVTSP
jgi:membrane protein implicated in regulation of membrane protease activity